MRIGRVRVSVPASLLRPTTKYRAINRESFEYTSRMLYPSMAQELKDLECPLDLGLKSHGVDGKVVMMTFDKDKCPVENLKDCTTGVALCDVCISINLIQSKTKIDADGQKVAPWNLDIKCFGLTARTDLPGYQFNGCELGYHLVSSTLDVGLEVGMSKANLVHY